MTTLAQVTIPGLGSASWFEFALTIAGLLVFAILLYNAFKRRNDKPATPYLGMPYIVVSLAVIALLYMGNAVNLETIFTPFFGVIFGLALKIVSHVLLFPYWIAGLIIIPLGYIYQGLIKGAFD